MNKRFVNIKNKLKGTWLYLTHEVWEEDEASRGKWNRFFIRAVKTILVAIHGFTSGRLQVRASALTYYSTLSIVPIVALLLGIAQGLGMRKIVEGSIMSGVPEQTNIFSQIIRFSERSLELSAKTNETIVGFGIVFFIWAVYNIFNHVESLFNQIWQIKKPRAIIRRFTDYMCLMLVLPIFIILTSGISVFARTQLKDMAHTLDFAGVIINPLTAVFVQIAPFLLSWIIFTIAYLFMPNTKVRFFPAFLAGIIAGTAFQFFQLVYISGQIWVSRYGSVYGSFAALPLFMLWLQVSWTIVLIGAELSFAIQNVSDFDFERRISKVSINFQRRFALLITSNVVKQFEKGEPALTAKEIAEADQIPIRLVNEMTQRLVEAGVLSEVMKEDSDSGFQPAMDIYKLTLSKVCDMYEARGLDDFKLVQSKDYRHLDQHLKALQSSMRTSLSNVLVKDL